MKKSTLIALATGLALSLSGLAIAQANTSNSFQNNAVSGHTQNICHKNMKKCGSCKCKKGSKCKSMKSSKCKTGQCKTMK